MKRIVTIIKDEPKKTKKAKVKDQVIDKPILSLSKSSNSLHRLSNANFEQNIISLLKKYNFQTFKQITVNSDDSGSEPDTYLLAWHEGVLVEIRILARVKDLTNEHIAQVANQFRESTSQANTLIFITSAKVDEAVKSTIKDHGIDFKVFDQSFIQSLVFKITGETNTTNQNKLKELSLLIIDRTLVTLNAYRNKLSNQQIKPVSQDLLSPISPPIAANSKDTANNAEQPVVTKTIPVEAHTAKVEANVKPVEVDTTEMADNETVVETKDAEEIEESSVDQSVEDKESNIIEGELLEDDSLEDDQKAIEAQAANESFTADSDDFDDSDYSAENKQSANVDGEMDDGFDDFETVDETTTPDTATEPVAEQPVLDTNTTIEVAMEAVEEDPVPDAMVTPDAAVEAVEDLIPDAMVTPNVEVELVDEDPVPEISVEPDVVVTPDVATEVLSEDLIPENDSMPGIDVVDEQITPDVVTVPDVEVELVHEEVVPEITLEPVIAVEEQPIFNAVATPDIEIEAPLFTHDDDSESNTDSATKNLITGRLDIDDLGAVSNVGNSEAPSKRSRRKKKSG
ncbi:hypothetical protein HLH17_14385 [Acinetobacter sp. ANC 5380]|uniref:Uncharacterized protein n=1 Tax=Acinetobacter terrae TaxID=2731247 RepID=A0A7Y2RHL6_9GAMM|nr:hypothetical protein [Acinetobacter terrae]